MVIWSHNKWVPFFGVTQIYHNQHTKNSAEKILCIACVGYLPKDNDMRKGGGSLLADITRAVKWKWCKEVQYFMNLQVSGSLEVKGGKPEFRMLTPFCDSLMPKLMVFVLK